MSSGEWVWIRWTWIGAGYLGVVVALYLGRYLALEVLRRPVGPPLPLEAVAPLRGRWLRLLLALPRLAAAALFAYCVVRCALTLWAALVIAVAMLIATAL